MKLSTHNSLTFYSKMLLMVHKTLTKSKIQFQLCNLFLLFITNKVLTLFCNLEVYFQLGIKTTSFIIECVATRSKVCTSSFCDGSSRTSLDHNHGQTLAGGTMTWSSADEVNIPHYIKRVWVRSPSPRFNWVCYVASGIIRSIYTQYTITSSIHKICNNISLTCQ